MAKRKTTDMTHAGGYRSHIRGTRGSCLNGRGLIRGIGINDYVGSICFNGKHIESYRIWTSMLSRLRDDKFIATHKSYANVLLSPDWIYFSKFKEWFDSQSMYFHKGWHLDKDLLSRNYGYAEKIYSPQTCCFLPYEINCVIVSQKRTIHTDMPIGVYPERTGRFSSRVRTSSDVRISLGTYSTPEEAFDVYKEAKEKYIKVLANKYKDQIDPRAYDALMAYEVRMDD